MEMLAMPLSYLGKFNSEDVGLGFAYKLLSRFRTIWSPISDHAMTKHCPMEHSVLGAALKRSAQFASLCPTSCSLMASATLSVSPLVRSALNSNIGPSVVSLGAFVVMVRGAIGSLGALEPDLCGVLFNGGNRVRLLKIRRAIHT